MQSSIKEQVVEDGMGQEVIRMRGNFSWGFTAKAPTGKNDANKKPDAKNGKKEEVKPKIVLSSASAESESKTVKNLSKFLTIRDVDLEFRRGEFVCIIGDVGSGKSSLLNSLIGDLIYVSD